jgi:hypothetical protein
LERKKRRTGRKFSLKKKWSKAAWLGFVTQERSWTGSPKRDVGLDSKPPDVEVEKKVIQAKRPL